MKKMILSAVAAGLVLFFSACEKTKDNAMNEKGSMNVRMTDAPAEYEALMITVTKVEILHESEGWIDLKTNQQTMNVLDLRDGKETFIASKSDLSTGLYTKMRVTFDQDAELMVQGEGGLGGLNGSGLITLNWKSEKTVEIELNQRIEAGAEASILLDFDVARSILQVGNEYFIQPSLRFVRNEKTGLRGKIDGEAKAFVQVKNGDLVASTAADLDGDFSVKGLEAGSYDLVIDFVEEIDGQVQNRQKTIRGIVVVNGEITQMGSLKLD